MLYTYINYQSTFNVYNVNITYWKAFKASCVENKTFLQKTLKVIIQNQPYLRHQEHLPKVKWALIAGCIDLQMTEL